jgi:hypothetical protein
MRHLSDINNLNFVDSFTFNTSSVCCYNDQIESNMDNINFKFNILVFMMTFVILLFISIHIFINKLIYKKAIIYSSDDYKTTIDINHII